MKTKLEKNKSYYNQFSYQTDFELSKLIANSQLHLPIEKCNVWEHNVITDSVCIRDDEYEYNKTDCNYYVSYNLDQLFHYIRDVWQVHINIFIDGGWTYTIEDYGNNCLPIDTPYSYDSYKDAMQVACKKVIEERLY